MSVDSKSNYRRVTQEDGPEMYNGRTTFRARPTRLLWIAVITVGAALAAYMTYGNIPDEDWFVPWFFAAFFLLSIVALLEALTQFLILDARELRYRNTFRTVRIPKAEIYQVTWTKGGGVSLKLESGKWVMVPDLGHDSQGLSNSLRAWAESE